MEPFINTSAAMCCVVSNAGRSLASCPLSLQGLLTVHCSCWNYSSAELMLCVLSSIPGAWCALSRDLSWGMDRRGGRGGWKLVTQRVRSAFLAFCTLNVLPPKDLGDLFDSGQKHYIFLDPPTPTYVHFCKVCCLAWRVQWHNIILLLIIKTCLWYNCSFFMWPKMHIFSLCLS